MVRTRWLALFKLTNHNTVKSLCVMLHTLCNTRICIVIGQFKQCEPRISNHGAERTERGELAQRDLHEENRHTGKGQHDRVRNQEPAAAVFIAEIGKAPHITKSNRVPNH